MKKVFKAIVEILNKEASLYEEMRKLYTEKRELLIKNKVEELASIDAKIIENYETVKKVDMKRAEITRELGEDVLSMTQIIELAEQEKSECVSKLKEQQVVLAKLSQQVSILNLTNLELLNHGMTLTDKKLGIIIKSCTPQATGYTGLGKEASQNMDMSTIIKDA